MRIKKFTLSGIWVFVLIFTALAVRAADAIITNTQYDYCPEKNRVGINVTGKTSVEILVNAKNGILYWKELVNNMNDLTDMRFWDYRIYDPTDALVYTFNLEETGDRVVDISNSHLTGGKVLTGLIVGGVYKIVLTPYNYNTDGTAVIPSDGMIYFQVYTANGLDCAMTTPVKFGSVNANTKGNQLQVRWTTDTEQNNAKFIVEGSADAQSFYALREVTTQAVNGNSGAVIEYNVSIPFTSLALSGIFIFGLMGIALVPRKYKGFMAILLFASLIAVPACSKKSMRDLEAASPAIKYVRIVQVDIDGKKEFSKVVQVVQE